MNAPPVRTGTEGDAPAAAALHVAGIGEGFLASLGPDFLARLYRRVVRSPGSFLLVVDGPGPSGVAGFLTGSERTTRLYAEFCFRDGFGAAIGARRALLAGGRRAIETLSYARTPSPGIEVALPPAELLSMAVSPAARGQGVGRSLVMAFQEELTRRGVGAARVVVASDNHPAQRLYRSCGFRPAVVTEVHRGRSSDILLWP